METTCKPRRPLIAAGCLTILALAAPLPARAEPLRIGVVGLVHGHIRSFYNRASARSDLRIVGIAEANRAVADAFVAAHKLDPNIVFPGLDTMLDTAKPEAVVVYTSTRDHGAVVKACAARKIHVMMEKPLAVDLAQARTIAADTRRAGIAVLVNYETSWYPNNTAAWKLATQDKALGEIRKVVVHDGHKGPKEIGVSPEFLDWLTDPKRNGAGALYDFGCYGANLMTWLMDNQRPLTVTAVTQRIKPDVYPKVDDEATIVLTYPRAQAILQASWNWPFDRKDMEIYGQTGTAVTVERDRIRVRLPGSAEDVRVAAPLPSPFDDPLSYLTAVVRGQMQPSGPSSLENNLVVSEILDAARRSAVTGKTVRLAGR